MKTCSPVYFDNNATTACAPEVVDAMLPWFAESFGNPASPHSLGREALFAVEGAREKLASLISVRKQEVFFNSGATEGNNWIFQSYAGCPIKGRKRVVVGSLEHKSVLLPARTLSDLGFEVVEVASTAQGTVDLKEAAELINRDTGLVAVQWANNETGVINPIDELVELSHGVGAFFHCDAVQALGKVQVSLSEVGVDSAVLSAHKIHGPKGIGALYLRGGAGRWPFGLPLQGGGQERGIRPGTLNVPGIVGFGVAASMAQSSLEFVDSRIRGLRDLLESGLRGIAPRCMIFGEQAPRLPNTTYFCPIMVPSDIVIARLPMFCVSSGSACDSGALSQSHVLRAMGIPADVGRCSIRASLSRYSERKQIESFLSALQDALQGLDEVAEVL